MTQIFYTIYKITNLINGKIYIGKHKTDDLLDDYMGSGKLLIRSQKKYGIENFRKEILFVFLSEKEMNDKEKELVTEEFCAKEDTYNLCIGGHGGFGYLNSKNFINPTHSPEHIAKLNALRKEKGIFPGKREYSNEERLERSLRRKGKPSYFRNKQHSVKSKNKMAKSHEGKHSGTKNSQFGTMWITDGISNKKINKKQEIPEGYTKGRTCKGKNRY